MLISIVDKLFSKEPDEFRVTLFDAVGLVLVCLRLLRLVDWNWCAVLLPFFAEAMNCAMLIVCAATTVVIPERNGMGKVGN